MRESRQQQQQLLQRGQQQMGRQHLATAEKQWGMQPMLESLEAFGPSDGTRWMFREETKAAEFAIATGTNASADAHLPLLTS